LLEPWFLLARGPVAGASQHRNLGGSTGANGASRGGALRSASASRHQRWGRRDGAERSPILRSGSLAEPAPAAASPSALILR